MTRQAPRHSVDGGGRPSVQDAVRRWAEGSYPLEAGAELLISHGKAIREGAPWIERSGAHANIDVEVLLHDSGAWSSGEQRIVRIAASLLGGPPVDLSDDIPGLDQRNLQLVLRAIAQASGAHHHTLESAGQAEHVRTALGSVMDEDAQS